ncbi:MAG: cysteine--tRNA ligase [Acidilobaceae archaeon]|nr:cysteine--tRNA ligase [Acidilobaceae archaeon]
MYVYNTLGRKLEHFSPASPPFVGMYTCGPTPYDYTHIGHARTFASFDAIKRYLNLRGYSVYHVQNITDIDDKIINRAKEEGRDWREVAEEYTKDYMEMLRALSIRIDVHPRVTDHIAEIVEFVKGLIEKGHAYVAESGSVYFDVDSFPDYGRLSGALNKEAWRQEEHVKEKKNPYDFALWKAAKPGEPSWESPWGRGRPGWHIECSVMSSKYLGSRIDIHGGGVDLVFPHHENERAQSEAYFGSRPWVRYWMHVSYLTISGEKMSKSLGNIIPFREAAKRWGPRVLRLWLLSSHYRSNLDYSESGLEQASRLYQRLRDVAERLQRRLATREPSHYLKEGDMRLLQMLRAAHGAWHESMSNDFNFGAAMSSVWELTNLYYRELEASESQAVLLYAYKMLEEFNRVYAVLDDIMLGEGSARLETELINLLVEVRSELRARKIYDLSDAIRERLQRVGIRLLDYKDKTEWVRE